MEPFCENAAAAAAAVVHVLLMMMMLLVVVVIIKCFKSSSIKSSQEPNSTNFISVLYSSQQNQHKSILLTVISFENNTKGATSP